MEMAELSLAHDFSAAEEAAWTALVDKALKGAPFASLKSQSYDGIVIEPLYQRASNAHVVAGRTPGQPWAVIQRVEIRDPSLSNAQVLDDLNNGADGLTLVFEGSVGDYGYALPPNEAVIKEALDSVLLDAGIAIELELGPACKDTALMLASLVHAKGLAPNAVNIRFGFDPIGVLAANGWNALAWPAMAPVFAALVADLKEQGFAGPFAVADGRPVHAAGGSEAQELAFVLSTAIAYLRALKAGGVPLADARRLIFFRPAADQDQFLTIAKFRALRKLWSRVEEACGLDPKPAFVAAETAWRMMTKRDPQGNIVRGTIAALAAAVGGADSVTVLPFSVALGLPDAFARRIARNTQTVLIEEANLYRVADPAAGSGAIEALTDELCAATWKLFQEIEQAGGVAEALRAGSIQREVAKVRADREADVAQRKDSLIGTSDFPNLSEEPVAVLDAAQTSLRHDATDRSVEPLPRLRLAEPFEQLRDRSDSHLAQHGKRPKIFLACLGRPADFNARASFAKSLFEAGGIAAITPEGTQMREDMVTAFKASGAKLACLCSSDEVYVSEAVDAAKALVQAGATRVYLAGKPGADRGALEQAGISTFLHQGCDTLESLKAAYDEI